MELFSGRQFWDRPCANTGLTSYRYSSPYSWIMIGAKDTEDALREVFRSLCSGSVSIEHLQIWSESEQQYIPVKPYATDMGTMFTKCPCCGFEGYEHLQPNVDAAIAACPWCNPPDGLQKCAAMEIILAERERLNNEIH